MLSDPDITESALSGIGLIPLDLILWYCLVLRTTEQKLQRRDKKEKAGKTPSSLYA